MIDRLKRRRESVLDIVKTRMDELKRMPLSKSDRDRLDMHFSSIRNVEVQMMGAPGTTGPAPAISADLGKSYGSGDGDIPKASYAHLELTAIAWAVDHNRSASIMYNTVGTGSVWNFEGVVTSAQQHAISHREGSDPETKLAQIDTWHAKHLKFFLDKLAGYKDVNGGSIIDNSAIVWTNEINHGVGHGIQNMPYVIVGGLGGSLKTGQQVQVPKGTKGANLWVTILQGMGVNADAFGVGGGRATGRISAIVA